MKKNKWIVLLIALGLIAGTAGILWKLRNSPRLTPPGVVIGPRRQFNEEKKPVTETAVLLPTNYPGASVAPFPISNVELSSLPKDTTFGRMGFSFTNGFQCLGSVVLMGSDRTSIHQPQFCLVGQGWNIDTQENILIPMERPYPYSLPALKVTVSNMLPGPDGKPALWRGLYIYWFVSDEHLTTGQGTRMFSMLKTLLQKGHIERWAYVSYFAACRPGEEQVTFARMQDLIRGTLPEFQLTTGSKTQ